MLPTQSLCIRPTFPRILELHSRWPVPWPVTIALVVCRPCRTAVLACRAGAIPPIDKTPRTPARRDRPRSTAVTTRLLFGDKRPRSTHSPRTFTPT